MILLLAQHGEAMPEHEDPERPLTTRGRSDVTRVARVVAGTGNRPEVIWHSDKLRARQTAETFAAHLAPAGGLRQVAGLAPKDDPALAAAQLEAAPQSLMLVGHLPHMSRLGSLLLTGDPSADVIAFQMGGVVCLERSESGWRVRWMVTAEICP